MKNYISAFILLSTVPVSVQAAATAGSSSASDLTATADISGTLVFVAVPALSLTVGPVNEASDTAPIPYSISVTPVGTAASTSAPLGLDLAVDVDSLTVDSTVDGAEGPRVATGNVSVTDASAAVEIAGIGLDILTLGLTTTSALVSNSQVIWDGASFTTNGTSNYLTSGATLTLSILGVPLTIPALTANVPVNIPVSVSVPGVASVTGNISLTVDDIDTSIVGDTATASASSVQLATTLNVSALGTNLNVDADIALNQTTAAMTAVPVPEPGVSTGVMLTAAGLLMRRGSRRSGAA
ncbi:MAG: hypothetical protein EOP86_05665 [Verrucomicrobiaceae bacterium]|nr:MAG: hypothetical protein EOP86_05665 [Verrucomicrobiaceae bacterium]